MGAEPFRIAGEREVGVFGFLRLEELSVEGGGHRFRRIAIRHPGAVAVIPVIGEDVVLLRQFRAAVGESVLEVPAGKLDVDGESAAVTASREIEEEIGFEVGTLEHVMDFYTTPGFSDESISLFVATDLEPTEPSPHGPEENAAEITRVPIASLSDLIASGVVRDAKTLVALQWLLLRQR